MMSFTSYADTIHLPDQWSGLSKVLDSRLHQSKPKMKLDQSDITSLTQFLDHLTISTPNLMQLQKLLPKTTIELLRSVADRGVEMDEVEKMAAYLEKIVVGFGFENTVAFDENTSHIIGREWSEIDYTGEGMTWEGQRGKYLPYGIVSFRSLDCLEKFFVVESKLPYFRRIYRPREPGYLWKFSI